MKALALAVCFFFTLAATSPVIAQPAPTPAMAEDAEPVPSATPANEEAPTVVALESGLPAPFDGLLLTEARFLVYANQQLKITELTGVLGVRDRLITQLAEDLATAREETEPGWFQNNAFLLGTLVGAVLTGVLVWGAVEVLNSTKDGT